ncbi:MAG: SufE family protein [Bacteroides sp.]
MTIAEIQAEILSEFEYLEDWLDKYQQLIDIGQMLPQGDETLKQEKNLIHGCQSRVWIDCQKEGELLHFRADSDAVITKGIVSLLLRIFDHQTPKDILNAHLYVLEAIGLQEHLSPTRANGLVAMLERIREYAREYL